MDDRGIGVVELMIIAVFLAAILRMIFGTFQ